MAQYLDADLFLALIKEEDRFKVAAQRFLNKNKGPFVTSTITCLELWFYLYRNGKGSHAIDALRSVSKICTIKEVSFLNMEEAAILADQCHLSPADAIHARLALAEDGIVSSDASFDKVKGLKRVDFT